MFRCPEILIAEKNRESESAPMQGLFNHESTRMDAKKERIRVHWRQSVVFGAPPRGVIRVHLWFVKVLRYLAERLRLQVDHLHQ
jgi:hypothetical protein